MLEFNVLRNGAAATTAQREAVLANPGFGSNFTDHMVTIRWTADAGWHDATVQPLAPFPVHPANAIFHYAQEIFEGLKAYRGADGEVLLFRPRDNARRFQRSAERLAMPVLPEDLFVTAIEQLIAIDLAWVPEGEGALYVRPFMFADEVFLGVRPASAYTFCVIASPAGAYFKGGAKPISLWVSELYSRAGKGGTGAAKCGGNYAGSLVSQAEAVSHGCDQVVFLDAAENRWVEELGGMNIFFVMNDRSIVTPPLGTILEGITRDTVIQLARDDGWQVEERPYSFDEWRADAACRRLAEAFACGTAAVLAAIGMVRYADGDFVIGDGETGPMTTALHAKLLDIQRGRDADPHGWTHAVPLDVAPLEAVA